MSRPMMPDDAVSIVAHTVNRLVIRSTGTYDDLRSRYEAAVPVFDWSLLDDVTSWDEVLKVTDAAAPNGFLLYGRVEIDPFMVKNGHTSRCTTYLMGNHTIAETMYGQNAGVMLYAPLRTVIYEDGEGDSASFAVDQPSTRFSSFDDASIAATGRLLDRKLAALLATLRLPVPDGLSVGS
jgi:hypothetical protein